MEINSTYTIFKCQYSQYAYSYIYIYIYVMLNNIIWYCILYRDYISQYAYHKIDTQPSNNIQNNHDDSNYTPIHYKEE